MKRRTDVIAAVIVAVIAVVAVLAYVNYGSGTIEIKMTDPPRGWGEASQIYLNYSAIEIHRAQSDDESGWSTVVDKSGWINLTRAQNVNQTIGFTRLQPGMYNLIRFRVLQANITAGGEKYTASVPSGVLQITITNGGIRTNTGQTSTLLIELNVEVKGSSASGFRVVLAVKATPI